MTIPWLGLADVGIKGASLLANLFGQDNSAQQLANANYEAQVVGNQNQGRLIAEMLRRSIAEQSDSEGNSVSFSPGANQWFTQLGPSAQRVQRSSDAATVNANTLDAPMARQEAENQRLVSAVRNRQAIGPAAELANYRPVTADQQYANSALASSRAVRDATRPVLQDTLRAMARTGSAAGPVISNFGKTVADQLRAAMLEDRASATGDAAKTNAANIGVAQSRLGALGAGATPNLNFAAPATSNPLDRLSGIVAQRAGGAADAAGKGAAYMGYGMSALNNAADTRSRMPTYNTLPATIEAGGSALMRLLREFGVGSSASAADQPAMKFNLGNTMLYPTGQGF